MTFPQDNLKSAELLKNIYLRENSAACFVGILAEHCIVEMTVRGM